MADYSLRLMRSGASREAWTDPESQRDAMEELARSIRVRRTDAEPSSSLGVAAAAPSRVGDPQAAIANPASAMVAAAALGMPHYGSSAGRPRGSAAGGQPGGAVGLTEGRARAGDGVDPWFSLRGHQAGRMVVGSAGAMGGAGGGGGGAAGLGLAGRR